MTTTPFWPNDNLSDAQRAICERIYRDAPNYRGFARAPDGAITCLTPYLFTWGILADLSTGGYFRRWCFETLGDALYAYKIWLETGAEEPQGYIRATHHDRRPSLATPHPQI